jgi:transcriptional regulator with XRE-family HTH domain
MHPIERYRKAKGWTQTELAEQVGVSLNTVQNWERGTEPRPKHRAKLAEVFGIDGLQLLTEMERWHAEQQETSTARKTAAA